MRAEMYGSFLKRLTYIVVHGLLSQHEALFLLFISY